MECGAHASGPSLCVCLQASLNIPLTNEMCARRSPVIRVPLTEEPPALTTYVVNQCAAVIRSDYQQYLYGRIDVLHRVRDDHVQKCKKGIRMAFTDN